jgi:Resolvase, N terminal domain
MIYGYARVPSDSHRVEAHVRQLRAAGAGKVFSEVASGARTDRAQLRRSVGSVASGDVVMVTRLNRLARSTRELLNTLAAITEKKKAGFRSLGDEWVDTTTARGRLTLTAAWRAGGIRARANPHSHWRRSETRTPARHEIRSPADAQPGAAPQSDQASRQG